MKLKLEFDNIVDRPCCSVTVNQQQLYRGEVRPELTLFSKDLTDRVELKITHYDKKPEETVVVDGKIVQDRSFTLEKIIVDNYSFDELIWESKFYADTGEVYPSCLFFGPNGNFVIDFQLPVLPWILKTRHQKNNNDPNWEQDYNYYEQACQLLSQISNK